MRPPQLRLIPCVLAAAASLIASVAHPASLTLDESFRAPVSVDVTQTRNRSGQTAGETYFRVDMNADGTINSSDATLVRGASGTSLTP